MITVSIISPKVSMQAINQVIDHQDFGCIFLKYIYERQEDIDDIYEQCKDKCDVIFFSGELGYHYIINNIPDVAVPCAFVYYNEKHILSILLNFVIEHPDIPLNRVYVDFLTPTNDYMNLKHYLSPEIMPYCYDQRDYSYDRLMQQPRELCEQGKIDFMLTRCTNRLDEVRDLGIPFQHILPTEEMIAESIRGAIDQQSLYLGKKLYHMVVLVQMICPDGANGYEKEYYRVNLYKHLVDFRQDNRFDFTIEPGMSKFELHMQKSLEKDKLRFAKELIAYLIRCGAYDFRMGVGIGRTVDVGRYCAEIALHESVKYGKNDGFMVEDQAEAVLTGPLSAPTTLSYSYSNYKVQVYSRQSGIEERNLLRFMGLFEMDPDAVITSADLSVWLNITVRSCNRILSQLLDSELIEELSSVKKGGRGRPVRQYRFHIENCRKTFQ